jgi:hypothetical protein
LGHLNSYDTDERSADNVASKVVGVEPKNTLTDSQKNDFLGYLEDKYKDLPDAEKATAMLNDTNVDKKENYGLVYALGSNPEFIELCNRLALPVADFMNKYGSIILEYILAHPELFCILGDKVFYASKDAAEKLTEYVKDKISNMPEPHFDPNRDREIIEKLIKSKPNGEQLLKEYQSLLDSSIKNSASDTMTLGKYMEGGRSYIDYANSKVTTYFDLGDKWNQIQKLYKLTDDEMFDIFNVPALNDAIAKGKDFIFTHDPTNATGALAKEWAYLKEMCGYVKVTFDGTNWIPEMANLLGAE